MPWDLQTPTGKRIARPTQVSITKLRISAHELVGEDAVRITWEEGLIENGSFVTLEAHEDTLSGAVVRAAFDASTRTSRSKRQDIDQTLFELLEGSGVIPAGTWSAT